MSNINYICSMWHYFLSPLEGYVQILFSLLHTFMWYFLSNYIFHLLLQMCSSDTRYVCLKQKKFHLRTNCINQSNTTIWHLGTVRRIYTLIDGRSKIFIWRFAHVWALLVCVDMYMWVWDRKWLTDKLV